MTTGHHHNDLDTQSKEPYNVDDHRRAHQHMWAAVIVTMTVIIGFWIVLLPSQLSLGPIIPEDELSRLREIREQRDDRTTFRESLDGMRDRLEALELTPEEEPQAEVTAVTDSEVGVQVKELEAQIREQTQQEASTSDDVEVTE